MVENGEMGKGMGETMENGGGTEMGDGEVMRDGMGEAEWDTLGVQLVDKSALVGLEQTEDCEGGREWVGAGSGGDSTAGTGSEGGCEGTVVGDNETNGVNGADGSRDSDAPPRLDSDTEGTQAWRDKLRRISLSLPMSLRAKDKRMSLPYFKNMWSRSRKGSLQSTTG
ncbi:hypothetical protein B0I37DRAFT_368501 [Chaetomium sp. MPI-CAGE-AT-0009]|nr:hypothetical protein B0I37DRAFT_368501 [Chaetomium sp. MPI-CAGE-AT-0009]